MFNTVGTAALLCRGIVIVKSQADLPNDLQIADIPKLGLPSQVLMSSPDYYEVLDVKNAFMRNRIGTVDRKAAGDQWHAVRETFHEIGVFTNFLEATPECEDMVFTANPAFNGRGPGGEALCLLSRMAFPSRQREVPAHRDWFKSHGYAIREMSEAVQHFEGGGDALWHPGRALIWAGAGARSDPAAHAELSTAFQVPVVSLELVDPRFYHLDTCFCALSESTALVYPGAFTDDGIALIRRLFRTIVDVSEEEASRTFACNAAAFFDHFVVIQKGASRIVNRLLHLGFDVREVETGEFLKAGGSVFCMKAALY